MLIGTLTEVRVGVASVTMHEACAERSIATPAGLTEIDATWPGQLVTYRVEF